VSHSAELVGQAGGDAAVGGGGDAAVGGGGDVDEGDEVGDGHCDCEALVWQYFPFDVQHLYVAPLLIKVTP